MIKIIASLTLLIGMLTGYIASISQGPILGNVPESDACNATTTSVYTLNATTTTLKRGSGVLCSVIATGPNTGAIMFYNATTSNNNLRASVASTTIFLGSISASATSTTYTYNVNFSTGLLMLVDSAPATTTVTWK